MAKKRLCIKCGAKSLEEYCDEVAYSDCYTTNGARLCIDYCKNTINKTICREKTEVEKLNKDCNWLFEHILNSCNSFKSYVFRDEKRFCQDYRRAWRNKGCEI